MSSKPQINLPVKKKRAPFKLHAYYPTKNQQFLIQVSNSIFNQLYPVKPSVFLSLFCLLFAYFLYDPSKLPSQVRTSLFSAFAVSLIFALLPVIILRTFLRAFFFRYKQYLFEDPKKPSVLTKFWVVCSRMLEILAPPRLETCNSLLPRLPVPRLSDTIRKYLDSMQPILEEEEFIQLKELAHGFERNEGKKLNLYANAYSYFAKNYVTGFWEKYLYLYSRYPLLINSNIGHIDTVKMPRNSTQVSRAAELCYIAALNMMSIGKQTQKPVANGLCYTGHYKKVYACTRIPKVGCDEWSINVFSRHVTVYAKGRFYKVNVFDEKTNRLYSVEELTEIFIELLKRQENGAVTDVEQKLAALTQDERDKWATNRERFFLDNSKNKKFLEEVENSIIFLVLDDQNYDYEGDNEKVGEFQRSMLTGNGMNRWADKSMQFVVGKNGRFGGNSEHSIADGAEFDTVMENFVYITTTFINRPKDPIDIDKLENFKPKSGVALAEKLEFDLIGEEMESEIQRCYNEQIERTNDLDATSLIFNKFGKDAIKKCGCGPDAFIQMALQLANYKDQGKFVLTYEAASGRFYDYSRTETLRTVCKDSCKFVNSMMDKEVSREERIDLLKKACTNHQQLNKAAMTGEGLDRHLFVLLVLSKGLGLKSPFLEKFSEQKWLLSTSQPPNMTNSLDENNETEQWMGGCFGAVAQNGYGCCYSFINKNSISIHITSYHSAQNTSSKRFRTHFENSLCEMIELFQ